MVAKLKVSDPNGVVVFDSTRDRVMSLVFTDPKWTVHVDGYGPKVFRYTNSLITENTYCQLTFIGCSWDYLKDGALKSPYFSVASNGYVDITFDYWYFNNTSPYDIYFKLKVFRR
jgi:hypothetical protein